MSFEATSSQALAFPKPLSSLARTVLLMSAFSIIAVMIWTFLISAGTPDPTTRGANTAAAILDIGVLAFREGLESATSCGRLKSRDPEPNDQLIAKAERKFLWPRDRTPTLQLT